MSTFLLKNIFLPNGDEFKKCDLLFNEKILEISDEIKSKSEYKILDCDGFYAMPGFIDSHVHFNTPGFENHETFEKGSRSAIKGGVTSIIDMPCTSLPPIVSKEAFYEKLKVIKDQAYCDFAFHGGVEATFFQDDANLRKNFEEMIVAGIKAVKIYTVSGMETFKELSNNQMFEVFTTAAEMNLPVMVHAEDPSFVREREEEMKKQKRKDPKSYAYSRSVEAELVAINTCGILSNLTGARVHIVHISSYKGVQLVKMWREQGAKISCETCPHYMAFDISSLERMGGILKTAPVVKSENDSEGLWKAFSQGDISFITTDHAPCDLETEKNTGSIWTDYGGIPGVETIYSYIISEGLLKDRISLSVLTDSIKRSASLFSLNDKGELLPGKDADITIWDFDHKHEVKAKEFESTGKYSPFDKWIFSCSLKRVFLRGELVVEDENILQRKGKYIK
ncbi:MAG: hypothetical protein C0601_09635 [Candidatus Muiribacterium halophilum]|uniref:Amidohydrolase-related domain-containing protein n=1 Tax=Muiribacterium halophilum TaxID=2053465 RepID=A0A2N5ZDI4_MUIH1|nr:MAG: hypothetical protein C0601_09635 [Candidatus Muirbacterium halophilum]